MKQINRIITYFFKNNNSNLYFRLEIKLGTFYFPIFTYDIKASFRGFLCLNSAVALQIVL